MIGLEMEVESVGALLGSDGATLAREAFKGSRVAREAVGLALSLHGVVPSHVLASFLSEAVLGIMGSRSPHEGLPVERA